MAAAEREPAIARSTVSSAAPASAGVAASVTTPRRRGSRSPRVHPATAGPTPRSDHGSATSDRTSAPACATSIVRAKRTRSTTPSAACSSCGSRAVRAAPTAVAKRAGSRTPSLSRVRTRAGRSPNACTATTASTSDSAPASANSRWPKPICASRRRRASGGPRRTASAIHTASNGRDADTRPGQVAADGAPPSNTACQNATVRGDAGTPAASTRTSSRTRAASASSRP